MNFKKYSSTEEFMNFKGSFLLDGIQSKVFYFKREITAFMGYFWFILNSNGSFVFVNHLMFRLR